QHLPGVFVYHREPLERSTRDRPTLNEIARPHIVRSRRWPRHATVRARPRKQAPASRSPANPTLQTQRRPQSTHPLAVHPPTADHEPRVNPTIPVPRMPTSQTPQGPHQLRLVVPRLRLVTHRRTTPTQHPRRTTLR